MVLRYVSITPNVKMPIFGLGTYCILGSEPVYNSLDVALSAGYRLFDTAQLYNNEEEIGSALIKLLPKHNLSRDDIFVTTKIHVANMGGEKTRNSTIESLRKLKMPFVDLLLIHYPKPSWQDNKDPRNKQIRLETWREMEKLLAEGKTRAIGVSNYEIKHIEELKQCAVRPAVNQCEFHPHFCRTELLEYCRKENIHFQAFTSLARNNPKLHNEPVLKKIADDHGATVGQVLLAWALHQNVSVLPKSANSERIWSNAKALDLTLTEQEVKKLSSLNNNLNYTSCTPWEVV